MTKRMNGLLTEVADGFLEGTDLLLTDWLSEKNVTIDECFGIANTIGTVLHGYLRAPAEIQNKILLLSVTRDSNIDVDVMLAGVDLPHATRKVVLAMAQLSKDARK